MDKKQIVVRISIIASSILLISIILMIIVLPGILSDTTPGANPESAGTGIFLAILFRALIFMGYIKIIRNYRRGSKKRMVEYMVVGVLIMVLGLIYMDGAFAFLSHENILYVSRLMFISVFCDLVASILTIIVFFLQPKKIAISADKS